MASEQLGVDLVATEVHFYNASIVYLPVTLVLIV
jgi:hypothetical protein